MNCVRVGLVVLVVSLVWVVEVKGVGEGCPYYSDFDLPYLNSDAKPQGPVTRIPASDLEDLHVLQT